MTPIMRQILLSNSGIVKKGLIGWYKFNEGTGQVLTDYSGAGKHGQFGSAAGVDTNDPTWGAAGVYFLTDDYISGLDIVGGVGSVIIACRINNVANQCVFSNSDNAFSTPCISLKTRATGKIRFVSAEDATHITSIAEVGAYSAGVPFTMGAAWNTDKYFAGYQNGVNKGTLAATYSAAGGTAGNIGAHTNGAEALQNHAIIYYALAYDRVLSSNEFMQNHRALKKILATRGIALP